MSILYIVPTPIGNLSDITYRAVETLDSVDLIACEDTRVSKTLLTHYGIEKPLITFHQHNEHKQVERLITELKTGRSLALITDAGTPGISDPGFLLIRRARQEALSIVALPGPDAATTALVASGLPCDRYIYEGFLPHKKGRKTRLDRLIDEERTVVLYESPHRIMKLISELSERCDPDRLVAVARELTKTYEEVIRGTIRQVSETLHERDGIKGEICVILAGKDYRE